MKQEHECVWVDKETGASMVTTMWSDMKQRDAWRKTISDRMFQLVLIVIVQGMAVIAGAAAWTASVKTDIKSLSIKVDQHSMILDKYIMALMESRMESQSKIEKNLSQLK